MVLLLLRLLPRRALSRAFGAVMSIRFPAPINSFVVWLFAKAVGVRLDEAELPISHYRSVGDFFTRNLRSNIRPLGEGFVSPIDGTFRDVTTASQGEVVQVKGKQYSVKELLGGGGWSEVYDSARIYSLYLSPRDYHRIHAPFDLVVNGFEHIPGDLWPVNDASLHSIDGLFPKNERIVVRCSSGEDEFCVVLVGATNVGSMSLSFADVRTNLWRFTGSARTFSPPINLSKGDLLGTFHLGSTVLILIPKPSDLFRWVPKAAPGRAIKFGETLITR